MPSSSASARNPPKTSIPFVSNRSKGGSSNLFWFVRTATPTHCVEPLEGCTQVSQSPSTSSSKNNCNSSARLGPSTTTTTSAGGSSLETNRSFIHSMFHNKKLSSVTFILLAVVLSRPHVESAF